MRSGRAMIGVTGPDRGGAAAWHFTRLGVWLAGGKAVRITPRHPRSIDTLDGLIIGGGADVDPQLYGKSLEPIVEHKPPGDSWLLYLEGWFFRPIVWISRKLSGLMDSPRADLDRDELEMMLIAQAVSRRIPILGICRGEQLLNVYFNGSLHQDLSPLYVETPEIRTSRPRKLVRLRTGSKLQRIIGPPVMRVNALHRQGVDKLGEGLIAAATDVNGIVQAIEHPSFPFLIGVQWHPEFLPERRKQRKIFKALVKEACRSAAGSPEPISINESAPRSAASIAS